MNTKFFAKISLTAALAVAGSVSAFAEPGRMKANIDFPFKAFTADMAPGEYVITQSGSSAVRYFYLRHVATHKQIVVVARGNNTSKNAKPTMTFSCRAAGCGLTEISPSDGMVYSTIPPKWNGSDKERLVTVSLDRVAGE